MNKKPYRRKKKQNFSESGLIKGKEINGLYNLCLELELCAKLQDKGKGI